MHINTHAAWKIWRDAMQMKMAWKEVMDKWEKLIEIRRAEGAWRDETFYEV